MIAEHELLYDGSADLPEIIYTAEADPVFPEPETRSFGDQADSAILGIVTLIGMVVFGMLLAGWRP